MKDCSKNPDLRFKKNCNEYLRENLKKDEFIFTRCSSYEYGLEVLCNIYKGKRCSQEY